MTIQTMQNPKKKKSQEERIHFSLHNHGFGTQEVNTTKIIIPKIGV